jgi:transcriptional regulator GlxA family with amidase domain
MEAALTRADAVTDVTTLAAALGVHRKTLFNMCRRAKFLGPAELLVWVRLALAAYLLETTRRPIERLAIELAYPSPNALRNAFRRHVGRSPSEVRSAGGLQAVLDAFARRVSGVRGDSVARGVRAGRRTTT